MTTKNSFPRRSLVVTRELTQEEFIAHANERKGKRMMLTSDMGYVQGKVINPCIPFTGGIVEEAMEEDGCAYVMLDISKPSYPRGEPFGHWGTKPSFHLVDCDFNVYHGGFSRAGDWELYTKPDAVQVLYPDGSYFILIFKEDGTRGMFHNGEPSVEFENAGQFANKYIEQGGDVLNMTDEAFEVAFANVVLPPKPFHYEAIRAAVKRRIKPILSTFGS